MGANRRRMGGIGGGMRDTAKSTVQVALASTGTTQRFHSSCLIQRIGGSYLSPGRAFNEFGPRLAMHINVRMYLVRYGVTGAPSQGARMGGHADHWRDRQTRNAGRTAPQHFCHVTSHWFECTCKVLRRGENTGPSVGIWDACGIPLEEGDQQPAGRSPRSLTFRGFFRRLECGSLLVNSFITL